MFQGFPETIYFGQMNSKSNLNKQLQWVQYPIKFNGTQDFLDQNFGPPYLYPHECNREKLDEFGNGAAPRLGCTKNEVGCTSGYLVSQPSRHKLFIKNESLVHQLFLISYLFDTVYRILDQIQNLFFLYDILLVSKQCVFVPGSLKSTF